MAVRYGPELPRDEQSKLTAALDALRLELRRFIDLKRSPLECKDLSCEFNTALKTLDTIANVLQYSDIGQSRYKGLGHLLEGVADEFRQINKELYPDSPQN